MDEHAAHTARKQLFVSDSCIYEEKIEEKKSGPSKYLKTYKRAGFEDPQSSGAEALLSLMDLPVMIN